LKNILIVGVLLLSLLAIVLVSRYKIKQRSAKELMEKNKIIEREKRRAEESEQFKSTFLANMSHEIRTPMNAVMGMTNLLLDESQNEKNRHYLGVIKNASENLLVIINDILDLSKMEAGKMPLDNIPFRIREIVANVHDTLLLKTDEKGLKLITDIDTHVPEYLVGDPARLTQVLLNLSGNAIKFTQTGSVQVTVECVMDTGELPPNKKYRCA
jgi:signal transduction histidine kinase